MVELLCPKIQGKLNLELLHVRTNEGDPIVILVMFTLDEKARQNYLTGKKKKSMKKSSLCFKQNKKSETIVC